MVPHGPQHGRQLAGPLYQSAFVGPTLSRRERQPHRNLFRACQIDGAQFNAADEGVLSEQGENAFGDAESAGPPDGLDGGDAIDAGPAGVGLMAQGRKRIATQDDLQGTVDHALPAGEVQCPVFVLALPVTFGVKQQVEQRRAKVGLVGLDEHLAAPGVEHIVIAPVDERPLQQGERGQIERDGRQPSRRREDRRGEKQQQQRCLAHNHGSGSKGLAAIVAARTGGCKAAC